MAREGHGRVVEGSVESSDTDAAHRLVVHQGVPNLSTDIVPAGRHAGLPWCRALHSTHDTVKFRTAQFRSRSGVPPIDYEL